MLLLPLLLWAGLCAVGNTASSQYFCKRRGKPEGNLLHFGDKCYELIKNVPLNHDDASQECRYNGGVLASVTSQSIEHVLLEYLYVKYEDSLVWIGLQDKEREGYHVWEDGSPYVYSNWAPFQGFFIKRIYEDCVAMDNRGRWHDLRCTSSFVRQNRYPYICQYRAFQMDETSEMPGMKTVPTEIVRRAVTTEGTALDASTTDSEVVGTTENVKIAETTKGAKNDGTTKGTLVVGTTENVKIAETTKGAENNGTTKGTLVVGTTENVKIAETTKGAQNNGTTKGTIVVGTTANVKIAETTKGTAVNETSIDN